MHKALVVGGIAALLLYVNSRATSSHSPWSRVDPGGFPGGVGAGFKDLPALSPGNVFPPDPIIGSQVPPASLQPPAAAAVLTASAMRASTTTSTAPILQRTLPPPPVQAPMTVVPINSNLAQNAAAVSRAGGTPVVLIAGQPYRVATPQTVFGPKARPGAATVTQIQRLAAIDRQINAGLQAASINATRPQSVSGSRSSGNLAL